MTSTPALGTLIAISGTDEIGNSYAATYPISLISVVLASQFMVILMKWEENLKNKDFKYYIERFNVKK